MTQYKDAESKTDSLLLSLVRSPVSLLILGVTHVVAFAIGVFLF